VKLEHTPEQDALREAVRRCLAKDPDQLLGITGVELGMVEIALVAEECGRALYEGPWLATVLEPRSDRDDLLVAHAADALGAAAAVLDIAVEYAKVRHQFGQPIGAFQAVQHLCVDMYETVELARGGVLHAAWAADTGDPVRHAAALRLKAFADRLATVGDTAIQVLGGIGFTREHDAHRYLRRLLGWSTAFMSPSAARVELARIVSA
jgi:hypothetical protein